MESTHGPFDTLGPFASNISNATDDPTSTEGGKKSDECALDVDKPYCSDDATIREVKKFVSKKSDTKYDKNETLVNKAKIITGCSSEECALNKIAKEQPESSMIIKKTIKENIKTDGPSDSMEWLNNKNIDNVLSQLCVRHPKMYHVKFHMANFDEHNTELRHINVLKDVIDKGYKYLCCVLNTDKYGNPGQHWVALFMDLSTNGSHVDPFLLEYFNSSGQRAFKQISEFLIRCKYDIEKSNKYSAKIINRSDIQHQVQSDSECGVFSLFYIWRRVNGTPREFFNKRVKDAEMVEFRKELFKNRKKNPVK